MFEKHKIQIFQHFRHFEQDNKSVSYSSHNNIIFALPAKFIYCEFCQKMKKTQHNKLQAEYYIEVLLTIINCSE